MSGEDSRHRQTIIAAMAAAGAYRLLAPSDAGFGTIGFHRGLRAGSSLEYKDFREYQVGDDVRSIDWAAYARTDKLTIKTYHEEVVPHLDLVIDGSRSMDLAGTDKATATLFLAAFFATAAANAGFHYRGWHCGERTLAIENGSDQPLNWKLPGFTGTKSPQQVLAADPPDFVKQGMRLFLSDLLWPGDPKTFLTRFGERASAVLVVQILARDDQQPPERGRYRLVDAETRAVREILMDHGARARYASTLQRHQQAWSAAARETGAGIVCLEAETLLAAPRFDAAPFARFLRPVA